MPCPTPDVNSNSAVTPVQSTYDVDDIVNYTCSVGYTRESGQWRRICLDDATWSHDALVCQSNALFFKRKNVLHEQ